MDNWAYKVSIIVPVYNVEKWLTGCIESLLAQTMPRSEMEILLIDDGSPDGSGAICDAFATLHPGTVKVWHKENEGLGPTRNFGIRHAQGKYMMYLDSDDQLAPETVKACVEFFDKHYDEVDLVTYKIQPYKDNKKLALHYRYGVLKESGVYDLRDNPYLSQTTINVCVKNLGADTLLFEMKDMHEDQEYNTRVLFEKMKVGFVSEGEYRYNQDNTDSIRSVKFSPINLYELTVAWYKKLFSYYEHCVPPYIQGLFVNDCNWKLVSNILYPYHYEESEFVIAVERLARLWQRVDVKTIVNHPKMDNFHKHYWISFKNNANTALYFMNDRFDIVHDGLSLYSRKVMEFILHQIKIENSQLIITGFIKSPIYSYLKEKAKVIVTTVNGDSVNRRSLDTWQSVHSYYRCETQTCNFWAFRFIENADDIRSISFSCEIDGFEYSAAYYFMEMSIFDRESNIMSYYKSGYKITFDKKMNYFTVMRNHNADSVLNERLSYGTALAKINPAAHLLRNEGLRLRKERRIWLYSDLQTVTKDNAYYQFMNDIGHDDGIERYYVYARPIEEVQPLFPNGIEHMLVQFGSEKHKVLYLGAEKILSAFFGVSTISPFVSLEGEKPYTDFLYDRQVVYLQHGVLHADLRLAYDSERCRADKIVVSSHMEKDVYVNQYHYEEADILPFGMARYDSIDTNKKPLKKILYAPSWRNYLAMDGALSDWKPQINKIINSNYYKGILGFLTHPRLVEMLHKFGYELYFKPHPIFASIVKDSHLIPESDVIHVVSGDVDPESFAVMITDISSYVFDFVYLKRAIMYLMPDYMEFKAGMNHYRELHLPLEEGFGPLTLDSDTAVEELNNILRNNCITDNIFLERMDKFFSFKSGMCREHLYRYLTAAIA